MSRTRNIFLVGLPGVGKSTIGKQLADILKLEFYDTDRVIEDRCGAEISWIFDIEGEAGFRERERKVVHELTEKQGVVLATGGGTIETKANRERLAARGVVVYLQATVEQLLVRTEKDKRRPLLQTDAKDEVLEQLFKERDPFYHEVADYTLKTEDRSVRSIAKDIIELLEGDAQN